MTGAWILAIFLGGGLGGHSRASSPGPVTSSTGIFPAHPRRRKLLAAIRFFVTFAGVGRLLSILSCSTAALTLR